MNKEPMGSDAQLAFGKGFPGLNHRGSTGPAEPLLRTTELPIWPPLISL